jgi:hypothetical protein
LNNDGTITTPMDGHCLQVSKGKGSDVSTGLCTGKPNQIFSVKKNRNSGNSYTVTQMVNNELLCVQGKPPPPPTPPPPPPCPTFKTQPTCPSPRCRWDSSMKHCENPPPPPTPPPTPLPPLPPCDKTHTCADNGLSTVPPVLLPDIR